MTIHPRIPRIDVEKASRDRLIGHIDALEDILQTLLPTESETERAKMKALGLTLSEGKILACLANGRTWTRQQIRTASWQWGDEYETKSVDVFVFRLRKKLRHHGVEIRNDRGSGFYIEAKSLAKLKAVLAAE